MSMTGATMPRSLPTTMSMSRTGDASSGTSVPFSFSCVKVDAMSATPDSAGMSVACSASTSIEMSLGPPRPMPRPLSTKRIGSSAKKPVRMTAPRSPKISQRISRQAMSAALPTSLLWLARLGHDGEVRVLQRTLLAHERDDAKAAREQRAQHNGIRRAGLVGVEPQCRIAVLRVRRLRIDPRGREALEPCADVAGERHDEPWMRVGAQRAGQSLARDAAQIEDHDAVCDALRLVEIVGAQEDGAVA